MIVRAVCAVLCCHQAQGCRRYASEAEPRSFAPDVCFMYTFIAKDRGSQFVIHRLVKKQPLPLCVHLCQMLAGKIKVGVQFQSRRQMAAGILMLAHKFFAQPQVGKVHS